MSRKRLYPNLPGGLLNVTTALASGVNLSDCQVEPADLADCAVITVKINNDAVTTAKIADSNVTTAKLDGSSVTAAKIGDTAVTTAKINNGAVTYAKIQNVSAGARLLGRYDAASGVVQEIALAGGLTFDSDAGTLASDTTIAITLGNDTVTYAQIQNVTAQRLLGRQDAAAGDIQEIVLAAELRFDTDNDVLEVADCGITTALLKDSAVSTVKLLDSAVTAAKIDATAVTTAKINDSAITAAKIDATAVTTVKINDAAVTSAKLGDTSVTTAKVNDGAITSAKLGDTSVITTKINDGAVTSAKLGDTSVITTKINANAVTADKLSDSNIPRRIVEIHLTDTTLTVGDTYATFFVPAEMDSFDLYRAEICAKISSTTGNPTIQIRDVTGAADMLSTKITLDTGEKTSYTAATPSVVDTGNDTVLTGTEIAVDVDSAGTAEDVYLILSFRKP